MPIRKGYGIETVKKDGDMQIKTGSVTVTRDGKEVRVVDGPSKFPVKKGDEVVRGTDADYDLPEDT